MKRPFVPAVGRANELSRVVDHRFERGAVAVALLALEQLRVDPHGGLYVRVADLRHHSMSPREASSISAAELHDLGKIAVADAHAAEARLA